MMVIARALGTLLARGMIDRDQRIALREAFVVDSGDQLAQGRDVGPAGVGRRDRHVSE
jgi:hypothetical protein